MHLDGFGLFVEDMAKMTSRKYEYIKGLNGHGEIALYVDTFEEVDEKYKEVISKGAVSVLEPSTEPWGQRTCYIADPEGNLIEIGSWNKPFRSWSDKDMQFIKLSPARERIGIKNVGYV